MTKQDWQAAFGTPDASFDTRIQQTLDHLKEEPKVLKTSVRTVVLVLALLLALAGAVYAASTNWKIGDYFGRRIPGEVPEDFDSYYQEDYTQELNGVRFHIRDAYMEGDTLYAITEVSRADGQPAIFMGDGDDESDPIDNYDQTLSWELRDGRSIRQYADDNGFPIYHADAWFSQNEEVLDGAGDRWAEEEFKTSVFFAAIEGIQSENGLANLEWMLYVVDETGEVIQKSVEITLIVDDFTSWDVPVNQAVDGLPVVVDSLHLQQSRMELQVDIAYHLDEEIMHNVPEDDESAARYYYQFILCDPVTGERLPKGARLTGSLQALNEAHTEFAGAIGSVSGEYTGDTIQLRFYDPWLDEYVGSVDVKIR